MQATNKTFLLSTLALLSLPALTLAAEADPLTKSPNYNVGLLSLVGLIIILLFVIGMLAATLSQLGYVVRDKIKKERKTKGSGNTAMLLLLGLCLTSLNSFAAEDAAPVVRNSIDGLAQNDFYFIIGVIFLELIVIFSLAIYINMLIKVVKGVPEAEESEAIVAEKEKKSWFWDKLNAAASLEKEEEVLLDHNYDGIMELDNSLPPWWKYGFYLTIVVAVIYIYRFHVSHDGLSQQEEFTAEMVKGEEDKARYLAQSANNVDENTVTMMTGAAELAAGRELFQKTCAACHLADGGGSVGPNLTDDYWLHGGSVKDIFKSIKYGWQEKGMKSWKDDFSPKEIQELTSFIRSIKGTKPATPKDPQGELYLEATAAAVSADSVGTDSVKTGL
jgi:cytochrome c oxidase cbb3-type subunit III